MTDAGGRLAALSAWWGRWQRVVAVAVLVLAVALGAWSVARRWDEVSSTVASIGPLPVLLGVVLSIAGVMSTGEAWRNLLPAHQRLPVLTAHRVFYLTQSGKYVPGSVWPLVAQASVAARYGLPARSMPATTLLFLGGAVATGLLLGGLLLPGSTSGVAHWLLAVAGALALAVLSPAGTALARRRGPRAVRAVVPVVGWRSTVLALGWVLVSWVLYGCSVWVLLAPLQGTQASFARSVGVYALSWTIGFLVVFAPAGAGPRDAAFVLLLGATTTPAMALAVAVLSRIAITVADLVLAAASVGELRSARTPA